MNRRWFLKAGGAMALALFAPASFVRAAVAKIRKSDTEWKKLLSPAQYNILREEGTEAPYSSPLNDEKRGGLFHCAGCDLPLFDAGTKYDSGTGWPSFYDHLPEALETKTDYLIGIPRTEYHCARCGGHHGHVFEDGPKPTGLRYCSNGTVLIFNLSPS